MYKPVTDLIFPPRAIPALAGERSTTWQKLVADVQGAGEDSPEQVAFILLMARLNNCATCNSDSFRAIHGCTTCSKQTLKRFHGTDDDLVRLYNEAKAEVSSYSNKNEIGKD